MFTKLGSILNRELKPYQDQTDVSFEFALFRDFLFKMKPLHDVNPFFLVENNFYLPEQNDKILEFIFLGQKYDANKRLQFLQQIQWDGFYHSSCMIAHFFKYLKEESLQKVYQKYIVEYSSTSNFKDFINMVSQIQMIAFYGNQFDLKFENLAQLEYFVRTQEMPRFKCMLISRQNVLLENNQKHVTISEYFSVQ